MHHTVNHMSMNHAAMAVVRELTQTGISHNEQLGVPLLDQACCLLHNPVIRKAGRTHRILRLRNPKQQNCRDT
ncbi:hypothetical protein D3C80_1577520 [compost metagenome]